MYLGNQPALSYTSFVKQDFTTSATTAYTLSQPVANENEIALFINFVRQEPTTAYTASGTSLTLTSATSASDDMYAIFLGKAVQTVNPPAGSVGTSQLENNAVTSAKMFSGFANGITEADQWRLTSDVTTTDSVLTANLERVDTAGQGTLGTGMTESSGIFTFPSTGIYLVKFTTTYFLSGDSRYVSGSIEATVDNSSYSSVALDTSFVQQTNSGATSGMVSTSSLIDVTDVSNVKVKFRVSSFASVTFGSNTSYNRTFMTFIRLGDT